MTHTFDKESIVVVDGFVYCLSDKDDYMGWSISEDKYLTGPFEIGEQTGHCRSIICCNNPSIPVPQLPELVDDGWGECMKAYPIQNDGTILTKQRDGFIEGYKAASKKQYTHDDMYAAYSAGSARQLGFKQFIEKRFSKPVPKEIVVDIELDGKETVMVKGKFDWKHKVTLISVKF